MFFITSQFFIGADSLGYSSMVHGMFENGPIDLVNYFYQASNDKLETELKSKVESQEKDKEKYESLEVKYD